MSNYTKLVDYAAKDLLLHGDAAKAIKGTEVGAEFDAIATMSATKVDSGGALGTPSSGTLTNCTGLPISTGVSGLGTGVATSLAINIGSAGAPVTNGGALGTPSSGTLTSCTGLPQAGTVGLTTADSPQFAGVNVGHATDTTITRVSAGTIAVEGVNVLTTATGASLAGSTTQDFSAKKLTLGAGSLIESEGAAVASATSTNIWAGDGNTVHITGTTTITDFGTAPQAGAWMKVVFDSALTLTHSANLSIIGGQNITTAAGDFAFVYADTTTQFDVLYFKTDGTSVRNTQRTAVASTSGTSIDFTGIPSGVKRIIVMFYGFSTNGTSNPLIQIGDSGGIEPTGYVSVSTYSAGDTSYTTGFGIASGLAANTIYGQLELNLLDSATNTWVCDGMFSISGPTGISVSGGKQLTATLDRVRITTVNGTDAFDAGLVNICYE